MKSLFDFNLIVQEAEKKAPFLDFTQNWFDVLTLVLTLASLWLAYYLGERGYKRDKKDKAKEQKQLVKTEVKLFKINLEELLKVVDKQLTALEKYKTEQKKHQFDDKRVRKLLYHKSSIFHEKCLPRKKFAREGGAALSS